MLISSPAANGNIQATELTLAGGRGSDRHVEPLVVPEPYPVAGLTGPSRNVAALYAAFARDRSEGTTVAPSFRDALRLHGGQVVARAAELAEGGRLLPRLHARTYALHEVNDAYAVVENRVTTGKVAVIP